jgi:hypothetical protein
MIATTRIALGYGSMDLSIDAEAFGQLRSDARADVIRDQLKPTAIEIRAGHAATPLKWPDGTTVDLRSQTPGMLEPPPLGVRGARPLLHPLRSWAKPSSLGKARPPSPTAPPTDDKPRPRLGRLPGPRPLFPGRFTPLARNATFREKLVENLPAHRAWVRTPLRDRFGPATGEGR